MKLYVQTFTVTGRGDFPADMLRYDHCWPNTTDDALAIMQRPSSPDPERPRFVTLRRHVVAARQPELPTDARWRSFGWQVETVGIRNHEA